MATVAAAITNLPTCDDARVFSWTPLTTTNADGAPVEMPSWADRSIHFKGTFGAGGTIVWEGSNDGVTWVTLADPQGNAISKTAESIEAILEITRYMRPRVTAGDGTTSLTALLLVKRW